MHAATLRLDCGTPDDASAVLEALRPEADDGPDGTQSRLALAGAVLEARITADDVAALRAAINSVARLADAALRTLRRPPA